MQKKQRKTFFQSNSAMKPLVSGNHVFLIECHIKSLGRHSQACPAFCHKAIVNDRLVAKATGIHHCKHHAWWQLRRRLCCVQYAGDKGLLEESVQALILKVSEDIAAGVDAEILTEWSLILRSVPTTVELHQSGAEKLYWRALNIREEIGTQADTMCRTTVQRLFEVIEFKQRIEQDRVAKKVKGVTMNASAIFEEWNKNVKFSSGATGDKAWKLAYVEAVVLVWTRIMSIPAVMELVLQAEDRLQHDSVWSSIYVLEAVAKKLGASAPTNPQRTRWIVGAIQYFFEVGTMPKTAFSTRNMSGKGLAQSKGTVDLTLLKYGVLELARSKWLEGSGLTAEQKELISSSLEDFGAYQKHFHPGDAVPDLSWQAALPSAGREYLEWVEKMCYGQEHDAGLKNMVLAGAQAADLPDREDFKEMWQKVQKEFKALNLRLQGLEDEADEEGTQAGASKTASGTDGEDLILMHMHHELDVVQTTPELKEAIKEEEDMHARYNALSLEEKQVVKQAELDARKYVSKLVRLVVEPERRKILDDAIKSFLTVTEQDAGQAGLVVFDCLILMPFFFELYTVTLDCYFIVPIDHLKVLVAFDQKVAGESITAPHLRLPTFKGDRLRAQQPEVALVLLHCLAWQQGDDDVLEASSSHCGICQHLLFDFAETTLVDRHSRCDGCDKINPHQIQSANILLEDARFAITAFCAAGTRLFQMLCNIRLQLTPANVALWQRILGLQVVEQRVRQDRLFRLHQLLQMLCVDTG